MHCVRDILREFLGHYFVPGLRTFKPKNVKKLKRRKNLRTFSKNLDFFQP